MKEEINKTDATIDTLQKFLGKVSALSQQLTIMEGKLRENRREWMKEKAMLTRKISLLTVLLKEQNERENATAVVSVDQPPETDQTVAVENLERDLKIAYSREEEILYEQERLEREVSILQDQIVQVQNMFRSEQYKTQELEAEVEEYQQRDSRWETLVEDQERQIAELKAKLQAIEQQQDQQQVPQGVSVAPEPAANGHSQQEKESSGEKSS